MTRPSGGYRGDELVEAKFARRPYLLYPLLLPQTKLIIGGEAKQHKSFILHSLIYALATGTPAFGMSQLSVPQPAPGILFSQELTETVLQQRWLKHGGVSDIIHKTPPSRAFLENTYCVPKGAYALDTQSGREAMWSHVQYWAGRLKRMPAWIALDPISKLHSKKENSTEEIMEVVRIMDEFQIRTGAGLIFCHHHGVMTGDKAQFRSGGGLLRGSSVWHADADAILTVKKSKTTEHAIGIELRHEDEMADFVVKLNKFKWHPQSLAMMPYFGDATSVSANGWTALHNDITNVCPGQ